MDVQVKKIDFKDQNIYVGGWGVKSSFNLKYIFYILLKDLFVFL